MIQVRGPLTKFKGCKAVAVVKDIKNQDFRCHLKTVILCLDFEWLPQIKFPLPFKIILQCGSDILNGLKAQPFEIQRKDRSFVQKHEIQTSGFQMALF